MNLSPPELLLVGGIGFAPPSPQSQLIFIGDRYIPRSRIRSHTTFDFFSYNTTDIYSTMSSMREYLLVGIALFAISVSFNTALPSCGTMQASVRRMKTIILIPIRQLPRYSHLRCSMSSFYAPYSPLAAPWKTGEGFSPIKYDHVGDSGIFFNPPLLL